MASLSPLSGNLGTRRAAHLLRRSSFRYTKSKVDSLATKTATSAVQSLLVASPLQMQMPVYDSDPQNANNAVVTWMNLPVAQFPAEDFVLRRYVVGWWLNEALFDSGIGHKLQLFFHQYNITTAQTSANTNFWDYLMLIRFYQLGNFKKLITKMVADNVMLRYLNNQQNTAFNPNENFAREFFELFTIGKGPQIGPEDYTNYTETDIEQAAKVFTGWRTANRTTDAAPFVFANVDPETGIPAGQPRPNQHNWEQKKFTSKFQELTIPAVQQTALRTVEKMREELQLLIDAVFNQEETARNFCRRLYRFFVSRSISQEIENDIIAPLAQTFRQNNFEVKPVLQQLLSSQHFYDADDTASTDEIIGGLIKSPLELGFQAMTMFNFPIPNPNTQTLIHYQTFYSRSVLDGFLTNAGMPLFFASDVAGYPAFYQNPDFNRAWFNSATIIARYKLPAVMLSGKNINGQNVGVQLNIVTWVKNSGFFSNPSDPEILVSELIKYMFPEQPDQQRFDYFYKTIFLDNLPPADWTYEWQNYLQTNNATEVKIPLERLINELMYAPEYQVM